MAEGTVTVVIRVCHVWLYITICITGVVGNLAIPIFEMRISKKINTKNVIHDH